jgi:gluconolactonase
VFYAQPDGSSIREVVPPLDSPNGVGLSPDGTRLYVAETYSACVWHWEVTGPGEVTVPDGLLPHGGELLTRLPGFQYLDSLAVDSEGNVCVGTLGSGGVTAVSPADGAVVEFVECGDLFVTNICFGGADLRTAYITLSGAGKLVATEWARSGLALAHNA